MKLDGAPDSLSSYAVRLLKETRVVNYVEHYHRMAQMNRKTKSFSEKLILLEFLLISCH